MIQEMLAMSVGGSSESAVKTGTFEVNASTGAGSITPFDTGLGSAIKRIVMIAENPSASTGPFSIYGWDSVYPNYYKYMTVGAAGAGGTATIGTSQNATIMFDKRPDTNNGIIEMSWTALTPGNKTGTYHWYAE